MFSDEPPDPELTGPLLSIGRYQVTDRLGGGGMGVVYLARDPTLERFVAIKLIRRGFDDADLRERFVREARAVASLRHPCIVTVFEYGDHAGRPFIVMEHVNGKTLRDIIQSRAPMSLARQLQLVEDLCRGLSHAHRAGIVHRDVKPANIMVDSEGTLKILDFGIAKVGQAGITDISGLVGTPTYMSPEQVAGRPVTRRSDIFSVGLVCFEVLAYRPAFLGRNQFDVMHAILNDDPPPLAGLVPGLDPRIIRIVEKALQKDPDRRYQDLAQMRREIERLRLEFAVAGHTTEAALRRPAPPQVQLEELARRRSQQIGANLENAERAFELGDYDAALSASEDALILDPQDARALESLQRAQAAVVERDAMTHLRAARQHFEKDELTLAEGRLHAAFELAPALMEGLNLQGEVESARQRRAHRVRAMKLALDRARIRVGEGAYESAIHAADEALEYDPRDSAALRLKAEAVAALEEQRRRQEMDRRVQAAIAQARRLAARDRFDDAWAVLEEPMIAALPAIRGARRRIEIERAEFEQLKVEASARADEERKRAELAAKAEQERLWTIARAEEERQRLSALSTEATAAPACGDEVSTVILPPYHLDTVADEPIETFVRVPAFTLTSTVGAPSNVRAETLIVGAPTAEGPSPQSHEKPDRQTGRAGAREWFSDNLFVEVRPGYSRMAFGVSVTTHLASATVVLLAVFAQPSSAPIVREVSRVFMAPASVAPPAFQPRTLPLIKTPPIRASRQAAPVEAPVSMPTVDPPIAPPQPPLSDLSPLGLPTPVDTAAIIQSVPGGGVEEVDGRISEQPVQDVDRVARVVTKVAPKGIPADALTRVLIEVTIDSTGRVRNARVLDSTPYAAQVLEAVRAWVFSPAVKRGRPVVSSLKLQIDLNPK